MCLDAPVFILGSGRCGTTFLVHALGEHPRVAIFYELQSLILWLARLRRGTWPPEAMALSVDVENVREAADMGYNWHLPVKSADRLRDQLGAPGLTPEEAIRAWADGYHRTILRGGDRLIHKTPGLAAHVTELRRVWPRCRIVHILRHPCAVIASYLAADWGPASVDEGIRWYLERVGPAMVEGPSGPAYHEIIYEQLLARPVEVLEALAKDLALPVEPGHRWSLEPNLSRVEAWRVSLGSADARRIAKEVADALPRWPAIWSRIERNAESLSDLAD